MVGRGRGRGQGEGKRLDKWAGCAGPGQQSELHFVESLVKVCPHEISSLSISLATPWEAWLEGWVPGMLREPGE